MRYSAEELYYEQITIRGYKALFTNERIKRDTVPDGWYLYEVRHDDECQGIPCEIAKGILVNFWGSLLMHDKLPEVEKEGFLCISEEEWIDDIPEEYLQSEYLEKGGAEHM
ncbi:LPD28 domain-containing protein [Clostridium sp. Marseille-P3244]|uniref:LPD28 domain-containing protein n=1 Tax=Clostridium sp. Marseille-P3244 TaxID=1871020 RepID=UPI000930AD43|nr:LPD28 domain-containing protein [Clostridium sp. Marseille-P3244]